MERDEIIKMAIEIATKQGNQCYPGISVFTDSDIFVSVRDEAVMIQHGGKTVFLGDSNNNIAVDGPWVKHLKTLYQAAIS